MALIFEGNANSDSIFFKHHSLVTFYLVQAERYADISVNNHTDGVLQSDSIVAIVFASMCIEAFVNEMAEDLFKNTDLEDFSFLRNRFKKSGKSSSLTKKVALIFQEAFDIKVKQSLLSSVEDLVRLRNKLIHYKLTDTATRFILPPLSQTEGEDGQRMSTVDFSKTPKKIIPPFVQTVTGEAADRSARAAKSVLSFWNECVKSKQGADH
ncbi:hypothetical protein BGP77_12020 [Saccharospirillum sp. MSK14-1]|uniref:hypothetical protein n=1 Tax=Saccharospirillum sp. MSK14-1 TaxID=1897632 RepID=UPI000D3C63A6|nr:hypothetical protein [Saccharospirillum sp. MSK14-1]PTY38431.1 hypothetical protein BGP77_12020 [Saccharospirillum sp. MSK14-1]